jgi:hypothetical protein
MPENKRKAYLGFCLYYLILCACGVILLASGGLFLWGR